MTKDVMLAKTEFRPQDNSGKGISAKMSKSETDYSKHNMSNSMDFTNLNQRNQEDISSP